jgi:hypothetical protein
MDYFIEKKAKETFTFNKDDFYSSQERKVVSSPLKESFIEKLLSELEDDLQSFSMFDIKLSS